MAVCNKIGIIYLVTRICLTRSILTAKISSDTPQLTNIQRPWLSYLPATGGPFLEHLQYAAHADHVIGNGLKRPVSSDRHVVGRDEQVGYPKMLQLSNNHKQKSHKNYQSHFKDIFNGTLISENMSSSTTTIKTTAKMTTTTLPEARNISAYQHHLPRRSSYQVIEELDGYLPDDFYNNKLPYHGNAELTHPHRSPQDVTTAIKILDRFLSRALNADSYNSELHPPPNPILALVLSRYGRYVPGTRNPRVYAYMAVNNIHNHQPFGSYKLGSDEEPIYPAR